MTLVTGRLRQLTMAVAIAMAVMALLSCTMDTSSCGQQLQVLKSCPMLEENEHASFLVSSEDSTTCRIYSLASSGKFR
jgi:hypothetical protein